MRNIVVLTGAGISAESGIKTFRASDGLWEDHPIEDVAVPEAFERNPALVHEFYNERRKAVLKSKENPAHLALARFEKRHLEKDGNTFLLVTQNIDDFHERAGSKCIIHMHGEILKKRCSLCKLISEVREDLDTKDHCEQCLEEGIIRPHIVWFGEQPLEMELIYGSLEGADLFVSIGTSGNVYPAAGFVQMARKVKAECVELNLEPSGGTVFFDDVRHGPATKVVPDFFDSLI